MHEQFQVVNARFDVARCRVLTDILELTQS